MKSEWSLLALTIQTEAFQPPYLKKTLNPTSPRGEGGKNLCDDETHVISPEPSIRLTPDHPVNSYLSVGNQGEKTRALYLSRFNFGGSIKCKSTFFQIAKLSKF